MAAKANYPIMWEHSYTGNVINGKNEISLPPIEILNWLFRYETETGKLYRIRGAAGKVWNPEKEIVGVNNSGHLVVGIRDSNGLHKTFKVHRICFYMHTGVLPNDSLDHINGNPTDNRISNLRVVSHTVNQRNRTMHSNNTSGHTGVCWHSRDQKWMSYIKINGKQKTLGLFHTIDEAVAVRSAFIRQFNEDNPDSQFTERHDS